MIVAIKRFGQKIGQPWYVIVNDKGKIGARKFATRNEADACALRLQNDRHQRNVGCLATRTSPEFRAYAEHYVGKYAKALCKQNTWRNYQRTIRIHLIPAWQGKRLDQIQRSDVVELVLKKSNEGLAPATIKSIKAVASSIFSFACEEDFLSTNPAVKVGKFIQKQDQKKKISFLTRDEVSYFLDLTRRNFPKHYPFMLCAFRTGLRLGEILALAWEDMDPKRNIIEIRRSFSGGFFSTPKSRRTRFVDMSEQLKTVLIEHRKSLQYKFRGQLPACRVEIGEKSREVIHLVFPNSTGKPMDGANFKHRVFYKIMQKAEIPHFRFHDTRHTFASLLLQQGESLHYVKSTLPSEFIIRRSRFPLPPPTKSSIQTLAPPATRAYHHRHTSRRQGTRQQQGRDTSLTHPRVM
ncbi:MAG: tyrosine-type recombinase/integrase [Candidatus Hodarchaeales archaeon]|jgi:integrase